MIVNKYDVQNYPHYLPPAPLNFQTFLRPCLCRAPTILIICIHNIIHGESPYWKPNCSEARLLWDTPWTTISRQNLSSFLAGLVILDLVLVSYFVKNNNTFFVSFDFFLTKIGLKRTVTYGYCYWNCRERRIKLLLI